MECPYCHHEMEDTGPYGRLAAHQDGVVLGRTFICHNARDSFPTQLAAKTYALEYPTQDEADWQEIRCLSQVHSVQGSWYTDQQGNLLPGYPC